MSSYDGACDGQTQHRCLTQCKLPKSHISNSCFHRMRSRRSWSSCVQSADFSPRLQTDSQALSYQCCDIKPQTKGIGYTKNQPMREIILPLKISVTPGSFNKGQHLEVWSSWVWKDSILIFLLILNTKHSPSLVSVFSQDNQDQEEESRALWRSTSTWSNNS